MPSWKLTPKTPDRLRESVRRAHVVGKLFPESLEERKQWLVERGIQLAMWRDGHSGITDLMRGERPKTPIACEIMCRECKGGVCLRTISPTRWLA